MWVQLPWQERLRSTAAQPCSRKCHCAICPSSAFVTDLAASHLPRLLTFGGHRPPSLAESNIGVSGVTAIAAALERNRSIQTLL